MELNTAIVGFLENLVVDTGIVPDPTCSRIEIFSTPTVLNYMSFDFFNFKFDHSAYLKI